MRIELSLLELKLEEAPEPAGLRDIDVVNRMDGMVSENASAGRALAGMM